MGGNLFQVFEKSAGKMVMPFTDMRMFWNKTLERDE
jgi:hypothetical protein